MHMPARTPAGQPEHSAELMLAAEPAAIGQARRRVAKVLADAGIGGEARSTTLLVVSELVTNAVVHGSDDRDPIGVSCTIGRDAIDVRVADAARSPAVPTTLTVGEDRVSGRGLRIVDQLADWSARIVDGRREVRALIPLG